MSFPADNTRPESDGPPRASGRRRLVWLLVAIALAGMLGMQIPREIGRWTLAAALEARAAGQKELAYSRLDEAMRWFPRHPGLLLQRAAWHFADGRPEEAAADCDRTVGQMEDDIELLIARAALLQHLNRKDAAIADCDRAKELATAKREKVRRRVTHSRAGILLGVGRFKDAVAEWKVLDRMSQTSGKPPRVIVLNGLAYARALAQIELPQALADIEQALHLEPGSPAMLDTRGYLLYLTGNYPAALVDMNAAVEGVESTLQVGGYHGSVRHMVNLTSIGPVLDELESLDRGVAVVRYHRALVLLALGREQEADADLARVRQLIGGEPDESLF